MRKKIGLSCRIGLVLLMMLGMLGLSSEVSATFQKDGLYNFWKQVGVLAGMEAIQQMNTQGVVPNFDNLIVMTNAGYAEFLGYSTQAASDGISQATGVSRGNFSLLEVHSAYDKPLYFAVYDKASGLCSYLQVNPSATQMSELFAINVIETINSEYLYAHASEMSAKFGKSIFGGNEFRIVTIMNAVAKGAPEYAVRAFEFHDHYCPGVTSGILMVNYIKKHFPLASGGSYFVQGIQPWCKEDALMVLLNATPGKSGYAAVYANADDIATWKSEAKDTSSIIYRYDPTTKKWDGLVMGFIFADTGCPNYDANGTITKLCMDLWYLDRLDQPEAFVKEILRFNLPDGATPKDWARPGVDPMKKLGLLK